MRDLSLSRGTQRRHLVQSVGQTEKIEWTMSITSMRYFDCHVHTLNIYEQVLATSFPTRLTRPLKGFSRTVRGILLLVTSYMINIQAFVRTVEYFCHSPRALVGRSGKAYEEYRKVLTETGERAKNSLQRNVG